MWISVFRTAKMYDVIFIRRGRKSFQFRLLYISIEGSYDTLDDAESKRAEAIKLTSTSGLKLQEVILKPLE